MHAGALWRDEVNSVRLAEMPSLSDVWAALGQDSFPILLPWLFRSWREAGLPVDDLAWRAFGLIVGLAIVGALWLSGRQFRRSVPILALGLFAANPLLVRVGDFLRPYGLGFLLGLLAIGFIWQISLAATRWKVILAIVTAILSVQCHYPDSVLLLAACLAGIFVSLWGGSWRRALTIFAVGLIAAVSLLPYCGRIQEANGWAVILRRPLSSADFGEVLDKALASTEGPGSLGLLNQMLWLAFYLTGIPAATIYLLFGAKGAASQATGAALAPRAHEGKLALFAGTVVITTGIGFWVLIRQAGIPPSVWYFFTPLAIAAVAFDALSDVLAWRTARVIVVTLLVGIAVCVVPNELATRVTNVDETAKAVEQKASKDDLIVINPWYFAVSFQRYYHGEAPWLTLPPLGNSFTIHRYILLKESIASADPLGPLFEKARATLQSGNKIWIVGNLQHSEPGEEAGRLPPAPQSPIGWYAEPYLDQFRIEFDQFLQARAEKQSVVVQPLQDKIEHVGLLLFEGWKAGGPEPKAGSDRP
jgi:hypothetical protein